MRRVLVALIAAAALLGGHYGSNSEAVASGSAKDQAMTAHIYSYLKNHGSPLSANAADFVRSGRNHGLDPRLLVAISGAETSFGTYGPSQAIHNPFGLGPGMSFKSWADAIEYAAYNLRDTGLYYPSRRTIAAIQQRWCPVGAANDPGGLNSNWRSNVMHRYAELGGNPNGDVFIGVPSVTGLHGRDGQEVTPLRFAARMKQQQSNVPVTRSGSGGGRIPTKMLVIIGIIILFVGVRSFNKRDRQHYAAKRSAVPEPVQPPQHEPLWPPAPISQYRPRWEED